MDTTARMYRTMRIFSSVRNRFALGCVSDDVKELASMATTTAFFINLATCIRASLLYSTVVHAFTKPAVQSLDVQYAVLVYNM